MSGNGFTSDDVLSGIKLSETARQSFGLARRDQFSPVESSVRAVTNPDPLPTQLPAIPVRTGLLAWFQDKGLADILKKHQEEMAKIIAGQHQERLKVRGHEQLRVQAELDKMVGNAVVEAVSELERQLEVERGLRMNDVALKAVRQYTEEYMHHVGELQKKGLPNDVLVHLLESETNRFAANIRRVHEIADGTAGKNQ